MAGMTGVVEAAERLERAVLRLEAAMERRRDPAAQKDLESALAQVKSQYAALSRVSQNVAARLDNAIDRLDRALEG